MTGQETSKRKICDEDRADSDSPASGVVPLECTKTGARLSHQSFSDGLSRRKRAKLRDAAKGQGPDVDVCPPGAQHGRDGQGAAQFPDRLPSRRETEALEQSLAKMRDQLGVLREELEKSKEANKCLKVLGDRRSEELNSLRKDLAVAQKERDEVRKENDLVRTITTTARRRRPETER